MEHTGHREIHKYDFINGDAPPYALTDITEPRIQIALGLARSITSCRTLFDGGVGRGEFYSHAKKYFDVSGIEPSKAAAEKYLKSEKSIRQMFIQDIQKEYPAEISDVVVCLEVLEHAKDTDIPKVYESLLHIGRKYFVISIASPEGAIEGHGLYVNLKGYDEWEEQLKKYFNIIRIYPINHDTSRVYFMEKSHSNAPELLFDEEKFFNITDGSATELSIVMPCLNENETVGICVTKALKALSDNWISGEVIVADNGSTDGSVEIARKAGARVVHVAEKGYGSALIGGIKAAKGMNVIMADSDDSYDFLGIMPFLSKLRAGFDLVMGNRFKGGVEQGAMPFLHKYLGNPVLSGIGRLFFGSKIGDFHCGMRGFTKEAFKKMNLQTTGMEFASEMVVKSTLLGLNITEIPTTLSPDGRTGKPHLRSFRDGWRHLRFLLMYSPRWLFLYPGLFMMIIGGLLSGYIFYNTNSKWDIHTLLYALAFVMIGLQAVIFAIFTKTLAVNLKLLPMNDTIDKILGKLTLEKGLVVGAILIAVGLTGAIYAIAIWEEGEFFELGITITMRIVIASFTLLVMGFQIIFSSFFFSALKLNIHRD